MTPRLLAAVSLLAPTLVAVAPAAVIAQTTLRWSLPAGQTLKVDFQQRIDTETIVNKKPVKMNVEMGMEMDWRVVEVDAQGIIKISQSFRRMTMVMRTPQQPPLEFDSAAAENSVEAKSIGDSVGPLIGAEILISMDARGRVLEVQLSDGALRAIEGAGKSTRLKALFSKEGIAKLLKQSAGLLPAEPVQKGSTWESAHSFATPLGKVTQTNLYTYQGEAEKDGAALSQIELVSRLQVDEVDPASRTRLKQQKTNGELWFDTAKGRLVESSLRQELVSERTYRDALIEVKTTTSLSMKVRQP